MNHFKLFTPPEVISENHPPLIHKLVKAVILVQVSDLLSLAADLIDHVMF